MGVVKAKLPPSYLHKEPEGEQRTIVFYVEKMRPRQAGKFSLEFKEEFEAAPREKNNDQETRLWTIVLNESWFPLRCQWNFIIDAALTFGHEKEFFPLLLKASSSSWECVECV